MEPARRKHRSSEARILVESQLEIPVALRLQNQIAEPILECHEEFEEYKGVTAAPEEGEDDPVQLH